MPSSPTTPLANGLFDSFLLCLFCCFFTKCVLYPNRNPTTKHVSSNFFWTGLSNFATETLLHPLESRSTTIHACFTHPGMYNLNAIRTIVKDDATSLTLLSTLLYNTQCIIDVQGI